MKNKTSKQIGLALLMATAGLSAAPNADASISSQEVVSSVNEAQKQLETLSADPTLTPDQLTRLQLIQDLLDQATSSTPDGDSHRIELSIRCHDAKGP